MDLLRSEQPRTKVRELFFTQNDLYSKVILKAQSFHTQNKKTELYFFLFFVFLVLRFFPVFASPSTVIFGRFDDASDLIWGMGLMKHIGVIHTDLLGFPVGRTLSVFAPQLIWAFYLVITKVFASEIIAYNFILLTGYVLAYIFMYILSHRVIKDSFVSFIVAMLFAFSPYHHYQALVHLDLGQVWLVPMFILTVFVFYKKPNNRNFVVLTLSILLINVISNYYAYFSGIVLNILFVSILLQKLIFKETLETKIFIKKWVLGNLSFVLVGLITLPLFIPFLQENVFVSEGQTAEHTRTIDDFIYFSARPWNFVVPSREHLIFGEFSERFYSFLENDWRYFLADDYNLVEHGGIYFGIIVLLVSFVFVFNVFFSKNEKAGNNRKIVFKLVTMIGLILSLSGPPFFTISGITLYTPSYLLYKIFPLFRVVLRLNVFTLVFVLLIFGLAMKLILETQKGSKSRTILVLAISILAFTDYMLPAKYIDDNQRPAVYKHLEQNGSNEIISVFPRDEAIRAQYWQRFHFVPLVNARDVVREDFDSNKFSKNLPTEEGISEAKGLGTTLIVVRKEQEFDINEFLVLNGVQLEKEFETHYLLRIL